MKYCHFLNNSKLKQKTTIISSIAGLSILFLVITGFLFVILLVRGEVDIFILAPLSILFFWFLYLGRIFFWSLRRFEFTESGLIIYGLFKKKDYSWDRIEEFGLYYASLSARWWYDCYPYFIFFLSSASKTKRLCSNLEMCFHMQRYVIPIRYSLSRKSDLERILNEQTKCYIWDISKERYVLDSTGQGYELAKYPTKGEVRRCEEIKKRLAMDDEW